MSGAGDRGVPSLSAGPEPGPGVPWEQDGSSGGVLMVSTLWALPVLRPVILTRREGDKAQLVTDSHSASPQHRAVRTVLPQPGL